MISITGIPGSGKSSVCSYLRNSGYDCRNILEIDEARDCLENDEMDIDCLRDRIKWEGKPCIIIEGHYSHLLPCEMVFILERDEAETGKTLLQRGYSKEKVEENLDALRSDIIYQEALELLPSSRIHRIKVVESNSELAALKIVDHIRLSKKD